MPRKNAIGRRPAATQNTSSQASHSSRAIGNRKTAPSVGGVKTAPPQAGVKTAPSQEGVR